jgi:hypothetical protein
VTYQDRHSCKRQEAKGGIDNQFLITGFSINPMEGEKGEGSGEVGRGERREGSREVGRGGSRKKIVVPPYC